MVTRCGSARAWLVGWVCLVAACGQQEPAATGGDGLAGAPAVAASPTAGTAGGGAIAGSGPVATAGGAAEPAAGAPPASPEPVAGATAGSPAEPVPTATADYYPLVDGAGWVYRHTGGTAPWTEQVNMRAVDYLGAPAFEVSDTPGPSGIRSVQTWLREGGLTTRVHSDELQNDVLSASIDYDPGFARFDTAWLAMAAGDSFMLSYQRTEHDGAGVLVSDEQRSHRYDMLATGVSVSVPAGSFEQCVQVKRQRMQPPGTSPSPGDIETSWFCPDVGKVKEIEDLSGKLEELQSCSLPACAP
jgi:hypothetical protein